MISEKKERLLGSSGSSKTGEAKRDAHHRLLLPRPRSHARLLPPCALAVRSLVSHPTYRQAAPRMGPAKREEPAMSIEHRF